MTDTDMPNLIEHVAGERWIVGLRADSSLLFFSAKAAGYRRHIGPEWGGRFAETMLVPIDDGRPVRVINLRQAKAFHEVSNRLVRENPQRLIDVIDGNDRTYLEIDRIGEAMAEAIECDDLSEARENGLRLLDLYEQAGAQFITAFSLGKELTALEPTDETGHEALRRHDVWRNSMALKEEKLECGLLRLIEALLRADGLTADPADLMLKLTVDELRNWLDGKTSGPAVAELAEGRDLHRLAFVDLDELQQAVIADPETVRQLTERFSGLAGRTEPNRPGELTGQVAFDPGKPVTGPAIVIRTRDELAEKGPQATGRIVVAEQTTPHYLPYLRGVLGIVTDEGGLTCHAAIVAREMRLPCIVGTGTATRDIADGDMIELRPNQKTVLINPTTDRQD